MQLVSARIWTRVVVSISYDSNHYTTGTSQSKRNSATGVRIRLLRIRLLRIRLLRGIPCFIEFCGVCRKAIVVEQHTKIENLINLTLH